MSARTTTDEPQRDIVVAVKLDNRAPPLLAAAGALAAAARRPLRIVHVFTREDPAERFELETDHLASIFAGSWAEDVGERAAARFAHGFDATMESELERLHDLAREHVPEGVTTHATLLVGSYPETLCDYAATEPVQLVIAGAPRRGGLATRVGGGKHRHALRLMGRASVPVLVLPADRALPALAARPLKLLLADDLTPASLPALRAACELASLLAGPLDVLHVHVEPLPTAGFALSADYELEVWPGISLKERLVNDHHDRLKRRLRERAERVRAVVEGRGGIYATQLWHGNVPQELRSAAEVHGAQVCVFGRHHFLHRQPLALGQMPFGAMLETGGAVLIAPEAVPG